jgi:predicted nucleic acid-binding protein
MRFWDSSAVVPLLVAEPVRFLRVHPLRAADALQLAAAFVAADRRPSSLEVVTVDQRLAAAARKEGFALTEVSAAG